MHVIGLRIGVQGEIDETVDSLGPIIDVVGGRPIVNGASLVSADQERKRLGLVRVSVLVRTINHRVRSPLKSVL
jgi:hypothetical protein